MMDPNQKPVIPQNPPPTSSPPTTVNNPVAPVNVQPGKSKKKLIILSVVITFFLILAGSIFAYQILTPGLLMVNLPIKSDGKVINRLEGILYRFNTELISIDKGSPSIIRVSDPRIPLQIVTNETQFFYVTGTPGNQIRIQTTLENMLENMTPNQRVVLFNLYEQDSKRWRLQQVFIRHPDEASASVEM